MEGTTRRRGRVSPMIYSPQPETGGFPCHDEQEVGYFAPGYWGERKVVLTHYWTGRTNNANVALLSVLCVLLFVLRLLFLVATLWNDDLFSWTVPYFLVIGPATMCHIRIHLYDYINAPSTVNTRFAAFLGLFSLRGAMEFLRFSASGSLIAWPFAAQLGSYYRGVLHFTRRAQNTPDGVQNTPDGVISMIFLHFDFSPIEKQFLNEEMFYIILAGAYTGAWLFLQRNFDISRPLLKLPIIRRLKFDAFKAKALPTLMKSFRKSFWISISFTCVYHFLLCDLNNIVVYYSFFLDKSIMNIDNTWTELFNLRRFLVMYLSCALTVFSFRMARILMRMFMLAPQHFEVELYDEAQRDFCLSEAMTETRVPMLRVLAFQHLLKISAGKDYQRKCHRRKIFALNPPRDLPLVWQAVKNGCLAILKTFLMDLDSFSLLTEKKALEDYIGPATQLHRTLLWIRREALRERTNQQLYAMNPFKRLWRKLLARVSWLSYVFNNEEVNGISWLVQNAEEMLIAGQALSHLVAASVNEDRFGVVQGDIPQIISTFELLIDRLTAFGKVNPIFKGYASTFKRSLTRIHLTFPDFFGAEALQRFK